MSQLVLDYVPAPPPPPPTLAERFAKFHAAHPEVYRELVKLARQWKAAGNDRCGIKALWERLRWEMGMRCSDGTDYKLNNSYVSRFGRLIASQEPDLAELFNFRELRS